MRLLLLADVNLASQWHVRIALQYPQPLPLAQRRLLNVNANHLGVSS